jgi:hypothetical protein
VSETDGHFALPTHTQTHSSAVDMAVLVSQNFAEKVAGGSEVEPPKEEEPQLEVMCDTEPGDLWVIFLT